MSATVLNNVNRRFEKRFSNAIMCGARAGGVGRCVGFYEAWVSMFDDVLNRFAGLSTVARAGETECGSAGTQPHEG